MIFLTIDTSTKYASVGLNVAKKLVGKKQWFSKNNHSMELLKNIEDLIQQNSIKIPDLSYICVARGPGGFSSLRVGISTAQGLARPHNINLFGIPTFEIEFEPFKNHNGNIFGLIPAGLKSLAWKKYNEEDLVYPDGLISPTEIGKTFPKGSMICGENLSGIAAELEGFKYSRNQSRDPESMTKITNRIIKKNEADKYSDVFPVYARSAIITKPQRKE